jgi:thiol reductant ABC exporter CydC subunit
MSALGPSADATMHALARAMRLTAGERLRLAGSVLLAAGATGAAIALLATSGYLISRAAQRPMIIALMVTIVAVRAFGIARAVLRYAERLASHDLALRHLARLRTQFYRRLAPLVPGQLRGLGRGDLLARFVSDVDTLQDVHLRIAIPGLVAVVVVAGAALAGGLMLGVAGAIILVSLVLVSAASSWSSAAVAARSAREQGPARAQLTGALVEGIDGAAELALAGRSEAYAERLRDQDRSLGRLARRDAVAGALASGLHGALSGAGLIAVLVVGIDGVRSGSLPSVLLAALAFLFLGAGEAIAPLPGAARRLRACLTAAQDLEAVTGRVAAIADPAHTTPLPPRGPLQMRDVTFAYDGHAVLDGVDFSLGAGQHVALVGPSGTGKTTLAELLVRFLDPVGGRVTVGGVDLRDLAQDDVRRAVLLCDQDAHLFNTTVRENLLIGRRDATEAKIWAALAAVELELFVVGLPGGLDARVGQQGELVSGGQRQRLALARALLADTRFVIFDEPVAHLDAPLARRVMANVLAACRDRGVLVITHAVSALEGFDEVISLRDGRIARDTMRGCVREPAGSR